MIHLIPVTRYRITPKCVSVIFDIRTTDQDLFDKLMFTRSEIDYMGQNPLSIQEKFQTVIEKWLVSTEDQYLIVEIDSYLKWQQYFMEKSVGKFYHYEKNSEEEPIKAAFFLANKSYMMSLYSKAHIRPYKQRLK
jgi:hypothetical protein